MPMKTEQIMKSTSMLVRRWQVASSSRWIQPVQTMILRMPMAMSIPQKNIMPKPKSFMIPGM